jgi:hypothetical protein
VLEVEPTAGRVMQPFGTPGARHSGAAFASVVSVGIISNAAKAVATGKAMNNNKRIA